jgi:DNA-binding CsgD family transcriptional regulator
MPTKHKRHSPTDHQARDLEIVRLRLSGVTTTQIARRFKLTGGRVTQILHGVARQLAPRKIKR